MAVAAAYATGSTYSGPPRSHKPRVRLLWRPAQQGSICLRYDFKTNLAPSAASTRQTFWWWAQHRLQSGQRGNAVLRGNAGSGGTEPCAI